MLIERLAISFLKTFLSWGGGWPVRNNQHRAYALRLLMTDVVMIVIALTISYFVMFDDINLVIAAEKASRVLTVNLNPFGRATVLAVAWLIALSLAKTRDRRVIGSGAEEYKRVFNASVGVLATLAAAALFFKLDVSRLFVAMGLIIGTLLLVISRWMWRKWLRTRRARGVDTNKVAIQGPPQLVRELVERLKRDQYSIYAPALLIAKNKKEAEAFQGLGIPVHLGFDDPATILQKNDLNALVLIGSDNLSSGELKRVSWNLEKTDAQLIVAPGSLEASGPRIHTRPVAGMPLLEIESPRFEGSKFLIKQGFDFVVALLVLIILSPIYLLTALAIKLTDRGPIFYTQVRHGKDGNTFKMIKFRSMRVGADQLHDQLKEQKRDSLVNSNMFKDPEDPRITRVGRFIRRYSIDELPQIFNVLKGDMSLVGPRPPLPSEVAEYEAHAHRRLLVKPGITGIWQVSGRSSLSWEETVRLDLDYVENWSIAGDLVILAKTVSVVMKAQGAY
jgi:exopolysaccharide biosynthesis polyprenyl glycosylphosphotransferase